MERIIRSVFQLGAQPESEEAYKNWLKIQEYQIGFSLEEDRKILSYINQFYNDHQAPPDFGLMREYFESKDESNVTSRLDEIRSVQFYIQSNFLALVRQEHESQQTRAFIQTCKEASNIAEHGKNLEKPINGKKTIRGVQDAVGYFYDRMTDFLRVESGEKLEGSIEEEADEVLDEYDYLEKNKSFQDRNLFGLDPVDEVCKGHKRGEYWIHCAFSGELKSTVALNYAYNNAYVYQRNIFYAMLEMQYKSVRRQLYCIHSSHGKFVTEWAEEDRRKGRPEIYTGLHYRKVRDGELDELERKRFELVAQDFKANCKGKIYIWRPEQEASMQDIKRKSEIFHNKHKCDGLIIDYLGLVKSTQRTTESLDRINRIITEGRLLALNFARGTGVPLLGLFQMNRQGKLRADKLEGRYDFAAIAQANQVEKDADVITYTYLNDLLRKEGKYYLGCIKNRDNPHFDQMIGKIIWHSKRMRAIQPTALKLDDNDVLAASEYVMAPDMIIT